eukprot:c2198_g1_i1 orf=2-748(-)
MGNPCICHTGAALSSKNALHTTNLSVDSRKPTELSCVRLPKQRNLSLPDGRIKAIKQHRKNPNTFVVSSSYSEKIGSFIPAASSDLGSKVLTPSVHSIAKSVQQTIPFISSLLAQIVAGSETLLSHITEQFTHGTLHNSLHQIFDALSIAFGNSAQIASLATPTISIATIFVTLTGSAIALRSAEGQKDFQLSLSKLDNLKGRLVKLQKNWAKQDVQREKSQSDEDAEEALPLQYDTEAISTYYKKRPF